jgi:16S rRNA C967 or C1407 C5-methylase (RsmB/RsmF family)/NOL1/NOP2/fmu family ribosome biogenesis protein
LHEKNLITVERFKIHHRLKRVFFGHNAYFWLMEKKKLPKPFLVRMQKELEGEFADFLSALDNAPPVSIRINSNKFSEPFPGSELVKWCTLGRYLPQRPIFTLDPLFQAGAYYVQEASSMFIEQVFKQKINAGEKLKVLDLCASPGGKTTHAANLVGKESLIVANETIRGRLTPLLDNVIKWGNENIIVTHNDPSDFEKLKDFFDVILIDAPCSGEGMFRKDPSAADEWGENNVAHCALRQNRILSSAIQALKPSGVLIYSTCTWSEEEDEAQIKSLLETGDFTGEKIETDPSWGIKEFEIKSGQTSAFGYKFYPHKVKGEGLFISCLRKNGMDGGKEKKNRHSVKSMKGDELLEKYIKTENLDLIEDKDEIFAIPKSLADDFFYLKNNLKTIKWGINVGKMIGKDIIPSHELALSSILADHVPSLELNKEQSLAYLRKQEIKIDTSGLKRWVIVKYNNFPLGWIKVLPNRINNYFPKELRIRM